jgi:1,2-dihydroxy-3-keto-5-methylthiopentene dioxygenase
MVLHPGSLILPGLLIEHGRLHTHEDDEALYVVAGECLFGILTSQGEQIEINVQAEEAICIPAGVEHWFSLGACLTIKAMRYFMTADGWIAQPSRGKIR